MIESIDDLAYRVGEKCRTYINEEIGKYFAKLLLEVGQRPARVMKAPVSRGPRQPTASSKTDKPTTQAQKLIALLESGPQLVEDLEKELGIIRPRLHTLIYQTKQLLKRTGQTLHLDKGNKGKGDVYALRDIAEVL